MLRQFAVFNKTTICWGLSPPRYFAPEWQSNLPLGW